MNAETSAAGMRHPLTGRLWVDQVVRREEFEQAHPEVTITLTREDWTWHGVISADGRETEVTANDLCILLDKLEVLVEADEEASS